MKPSKGNFSGKDLEKLFQAPDNKTGNLATLLPLLPGMPVRYTQNIAVELAISNGADGVLVGVDFPLGTTFSQATLQSGKHIAICCICSFSAGSPHNTREVFYSTYQISSRHRSCSTILAHQHTIRNERKYGLEYGQRHFHPAAPVCAIICCYIL